MSRRAIAGSVLLLATLVAFGGTLTAWKVVSLQQAKAAAATQPEPMETIAVAIAQSREHRPVTTSIGTVLAFRSISLLNELAGTVREVKLPSGAVVDEGEILVKLDVSVEEAELNAQTAKAKLADTVLDRAQRLSRNGAVPAEQVDHARSERDVAVAQIARIQAIIAKKTIRSPFRARVGLADVHPGQYLEEGTQLTTLQGVDDAVHVDFTVAQRVARDLHEGDLVEVFAAADIPPISAKIVAIDARVDAITRNAMVRAIIENAENTPTPGASVQVRVPIGPARTATAVPATAVRKGAGGDHLFIIAPDDKGQTRAQLRRIESGPMVDEEILVLDGLEPGEQVATSGSFKLRQGTLVMIASDPKPLADGN